MSLVTSVGNGCRYSGNIDLFQQIMTAHPTSRILQLKFWHLCPVVKRNGTSETWATGLSLCLHSPDWGLHCMVWGSCARNRKLACISPSASKVMPQSYSRLLALKPRPRPGLPYWNPETYMHRAIPHNHPSLSRRINHQESLASPRPGGTDWPFLRASLITFS